MEPEKNTMEVEKNTNVVDGGEITTQNAPSQVPKQSSGQKFISILAVFCVLIVVIVGGAIGYRQMNKTKISEIAQVVGRQPEATPTPTPLPLPQGPRVFKYSHGAEVVGPKPQEVQISTVDPGMNGKQKLSVSITHNAPITEAAVNLVTDNKETRHVLTRVSGDEYSGTWEGEWTVDDTYNNKYFIEFEIKSSTTTYKDGLSFR